MSCGCAANTCDSILLARRAAVCTLNKLRGEPFDYIRIRPTTFSAASGAATAPAESPVEFWATPHRDRSSYLTRAIATALQGTTQAQKRQIMLEAGQLFTEDVPGTKVEFLPKVGDRIERPAAAHRVDPGEFQVFTVDEIETQTEGSHGHAVSHVITLGTTSKP